MLRGDAEAARRVWGIVLTALIGVACAALVSLGNPGNMGICGACFLRDIAGSLGFMAGKGPACFRPEVVGVILGALALTLFRSRFVARSGSHAVSRFVLGFWMALAALVFLGCPFRMLQRLGGGDLNAWAALPGFVMGVYGALLLERRGYSIGSTSPVPAPVGILGPLGALGLLGLFLLPGHRLLGPGPGGLEKPPHAPWLWALGISLAAGAILSATGFCAVSSARQVFQQKKAMLVAALALIGGYAAVSVATGRFHLGFSGQPIAHGELLWNSLALALLGLTGALAGGCPVRQLVMVGEGNGDAFVTVCGILAGGAVAHTLGMVAIPAAAGVAGSVPMAGRIAVVIGLLVSGLYGCSMVWRGAPGRTKS